MHYPAKRGKGTSSFWWVDLGGMPGIHQATLSLPLLNWIGGEKYNRSLVSQDRDRKITLQSPSWAKQTQIRKIIKNQIRAG